MTTTMERTYLTDRGHPVPYVADWSGESREYAMFDATFGRFAVFTAGRRGDGVPVLGKMNPARQRDCMANYRCQVCYCPLAAPYTAAVWPGQVAVDPSTGLPCPLLLEPWTCAPCMAIAMRACPGLARHRAKVVTVHRHTLVMTLCKPMGALAKVKGLPAGGVVSYIKAILLDYSDVAPAPAHGV